MGKAYSHGSILSTRFRRQPFDLVTANVKKNKNSL